MPRSLTPVPELKGPADALPQSTSTGPGRPRPDLSPTTIVICTSGMRGLLLRCLGSLASVPADWEIIVVVNGNADGTVEATRERFPRLRLIVNSQNRGVARGCNQGFSVAWGDVVILLDADTEVAGGVLEQLVETLKAEPDAGIVGPRLVSSSGVAQSNARSFPTLWTKVRRRAPAALRRFLPSDELADPQRLRSVGYVLGACQAIRRTALQNVGALDEAMFYGPADVDLCLRMWKSGWRVLWDPTVTVMHHEQRATWRRPVSLLTLRHGLGLARYFLKHRYLIRSPRFGIETSSGTADR